MILAEMSDLIAQFPGECRKHRKRQGKTSVEVSDETGLTETIISRFERGETKNPCVYNVMAYCKAIGFDMTGYFGLVPTAAEPAADDAALRVHISYLEKENAEKDAVIQRLLRNRNIMFYTFSGILAMIIIGLVLIDLLNPNFGILRRA